VKMATMKDFDVVNPSYCLFCQKISIESQNVHLPKQDHLQRVLRQIETYKKML